MLDIGPYTYYLGGIIYFFVFVCGLILGSFLNSWMWRVRDNIRILSNARSICPFCRYQLRWYENIPLFSWIFLRAHCKNCGKKIHWSYFFVELFTGLLLIFVSYQFLNMPHFSEWNLFRDVFFLTFLIIIFVYDCRYKEVIEKVVWSGALVGLLINRYALHFTWGNLWWGALVGFGFFFLQYIISHGRWIGGGDVRLGLMLGFWLGWPNIAVALFLAYIIGAVVAVPLLVLKKVGRQTEVPFGVFLAVGTFIAIYYGPELIQWYLGLMR